MQREQPITCVADAPIFEVFNSSPTPGQIIIDLDINTTTLFTIYVRFKI